LPFTRRENNIAREIAPPAAAVTALDANDAPTVPLLSKDPQTAWLGFLLIKSVGKFERTSNDRQGVKRRHK
jgi:hypothetical protein